MTQTPEQSAKTQAQPLLQIAALSWTPQTQPVLDSISLHIEAGQFVGVLGPNGAGKSSLLRCLYRHIKPTTGQILFDGEDIWQRSPKWLARQLAVIQQEQHDHLGLTVAEVIALGRIPHKRLLEWDTPHDRQLINDVMQKLELDALASAPFARLSGGEKQRCCLARAMVQAPRFLVMDEPTNHLDVHYQIDLLHRVRQLGITVLASFHDLNLAAAFCDRLVVLDHGRLVAEGTPEEVLTESLLATTFRACGLVDRHPLHGHPRVTFSSQPHASVKES